MDLIPNDRLRQAFQERNINWGLVCENLGCPEREVSRFRRQLGMVDETNHGRRERRERIKYENAVRLARAADIDPVDVGL